MKTLVRHRKGEKKGQTELLDADEAKKLVDAKAADEIDPDDETEEERKARMSSKTKTTSDDDDDEDDEDAKKAFNSVVEKLTAVVQREVNVAVTKQVGQLTKGLSDGLTITTKDNRLDDRTNGFSSIGEFFHDVAMEKTQHVTSKKMAAYRQFLKDWDLIQKADGMSEGNTNLGGSLVPVEYSDQLYRDVMQESPLWGKARKYPISMGASIVIPTRTTTNYGQTASGGGSLGQWTTPDGTIIPPKAPTYGKVTLTLNKWTTLLPVTDELLADNNVALSTFIVEEGIIAMAYDMNAAFINGSGSGQPTGILQSVNNPAYYATPGNLGTAIGVDRQTAGTIQYADLVNMRAHLWTVRPNDRKDVVWIAHPDAEAQFEQLKDSAGRNLYYAAGTIQQSPVPRLFGIPVVYSYHCGAVGTEGDLILADLGQYFTATKQGGGIQTAMSIHLYFASDETAFRTVFRVAGQPARNTALVVPNSGNVRMGFVALNYVGS